MLDLTLEVGEGGHDAGRLRTAQHGLVPAPQLGHAHGSLPEADVLRPRVEDVLVARLGGRHPYVRVLEAARAGVAEVAVDDTVVD